MGTILEFQIEAEATACLAEYDAMAKQALLAMGYEEDADGRILGRNRKTRKTVPTALTTSWAVIQESPDASFYFANPRKNGSESDAMVQGWVDAGLCVERDIPPEWIPDEETPTP